MFCYNEFWFVDQKKKENNTRRVMNVSILVIPNITRNMNIKEFENLQCILLFYFFIYFLYENLKISILTHL